MKFFKDRDSSKFTGGLDKWGDWTSSNTVDIFKKTNIIEVEKLDWNKLNLNNFEECVRNDYIKFKVQRLWYFKIDCCLLCKPILKNISEISPIELRISYLKFVSDSIKINKL